ncbi:MAG: hypothetical protein IKO40_07250, partial [Kiritimatiellae bacterium]|nr:hypothetical protein [Kiritimatiellia bacterium]
KRPAILIANKMDIDGARENMMRLEKSARRKALAVSAADGEGIDALLDAIRRIIKPSVPGTGVKTKKSPRAAKPAATSVFHAEVNPEKLARATFLSL